MTTTLLFGTPPSIFQPRVFLVSFISYTFRYGKPSSDTATYSITFQVNGGKGMGGQCPIIPRQIGTGGEFLYFDGAGGQASISAACTCLCSPGTKQTTSGFCSNTYLNCKPCTNLHNKYFLTKQSNGDVVSSQDPETPCPCHLHPTGTPRSQTYFSCPRSKAVFAMTSQRGCFSRVIRNIRLQDTEVPTQDQLRT